MSPSDLKSRNVLYKMKFPRENNSALQIEWPSLSHFKFRHQERPLSNYINTTEAGS